MIARNGIEFHHHHTTMRSPYHHYHHFITSLWENDTSSPECFIRSDQVEKSEFFGAKLRWFDVIKFMSSLIEILRRILYQKFCTPSMVWSWFLEIRHPKLSLSPKYSWEYNWNRICFARAEGAGGFGLGLRLRVPVALPPFRMKFCCLASQKNSFSIFPSDKEWLNRTFKNLNASPFFNLDFSNFYFLFFIFLGKTLQETLKCFF